MNLTPNFTLREFASRGEPVPSAYMDNVIQLAQNLQKLRDRLGKVIKITSGYRTREHNIAVGGVTNSQHLYAKAADFIVQGTLKADVYCAIEALIAEGKMVNGGLGYYGEGDHHIHYDIGPARRWTGPGVAVPECPPPQEEEMASKEYEELKKAQENMRRFFATALTDHEERLDKGQEFQDGIAIYFGEMARKQGEMAEQQRDHERRIKKLEAPEGDPALD